MATSILSASELDFTSNGSATVAKITASASTIDFEGVSSADITITGVDSLNVATTLQLAGAGVATQTYVNSQIDGRHWKDAVQCATTAALSGANAYTQSGTGVGAKLTADANGILGLIDGIQLEIAAGQNRILIKDETAADAPHNGIYELTDKGSAGTPWIMTRATDADSDAEIFHATVLVQGGTTNGNSIYTISNDTEPTIDTTDITTANIGGGSGLSATGDGLTDDGTTVNMQLDGSSLSKSGAGVKVADNGVGIAQLTGLTRGTVFVGDAAGDPSVKTAGTSAQLFQADGNTDPQWVSMSGDATIAAGGAITIADNAVSLAKMAGIAQGGVIYGDASGDPATLDVGGTNGGIMIGDGNDVAVAAVSGDVAIASNGVATIQANAVEGTMLNSNVPGLGLSLSGGTLRADNRLIKAPCAFVTVGALDSYTYSSGAGTLTKQAPNGALTVDSVAVAQGDRILVTGDGTTDNSHNGIYEVTATGSGAAVWVLTRTSDANANGDFGLHSEVWVMEGSSKSTTKWYLSGATGAADEDSIAIGAEAKEFSEISLGGSITGGDGIDVTGSTVSVDLVGADPGLEISGAKLQVLLNPSNPGITKTGGGLAIGAGDGLSVTGNNVAVDLHTTSPGLEIDTAQLRIKAAYGITLTTDGANVNLLVKDAVRCATTGNGTLASAYANTQIVDGVTLATGDRILIKDQSTASEDGIYIVQASGAPTRSSDTDDTNLLETHAYTHVIEGTVNANRTFYISNSNPVVTDQQWDGEYGVSATSGESTLTAGTLSLDKHPTTMGTAANNEYLSTGAANRNLTNMGSVTDDGASTSSFQTHTSTSDRRLKKDIETIEPEAALAAVCKSRPTTFTYKANEKACAGFIAQELGEICPELVGHVDAMSSGDGEEYLTLNYSGFTGYLAGAVQALAAETRELRSQITGLKRKSRESRESEEDGGEAKRR